MAAPKVVTRPSTPPPAPPPPPAVSPSPDTDHIDYDRPCRGCGYNLIGLPRSGRCPECGLSIRVKRSWRYGDTLVEAPIPYLRWLSFGCVLMAAGGPLCSVAFLLSGRLGQRALMLTVPGAIAWWLGVLVVTRTRPVRGEFIAARGWPLAWRRVTRATQACWIVAAAAVPLAPGPVVPWYAWMPGAVALAGLTPLALHISDLAEWARNSTLSATLRVVASTIMVAGVLSVVCSLPPNAGLWGGFAHVVLGPSILMFFAAQALFLWSVVRLAFTTRWAMANAISARDKNLRFRDRFEAERARAAAERGA